MTFYRMPERYKNSFYLANASLFDTVNWFLHKSYEVCFEKLTKMLNMKQTQAIDKIADYILMLEQCNSIIDVRFPIKRETGLHEVVRGFRAQHGLFNKNSVASGGLRIDEYITRDQMKALSVLSTYRNACFGINLAGAHGGIKINPNNYSENELKMIVEMYATEMHKRGYCNDSSDLITPDYMANSREINWIQSVASKKSSATQKATGTVLRDLENLQKITGQGVFFALDFLLENEQLMQEIGLGKGLKDKTFIIQGLGKVGAPLAQYLENNGAKCVGVKEFDAYIYNPSGIQVQSVIDLWKKHGSLSSLEGVKPLQGYEIFLENCDILILAANYKSLTYSFAKDIKAKIIVEAADCAMSPTAHRILVGLRKLVIPDIYVNSAMSVVSYLEHLHNLKQPLNLNCKIYQKILESLYDSEKSQKVVLASTTQKIKTCAMEHDIITYGIECIMTETGKEIVALAKEYDLDLDLRTAAYIASIQNIFQNLPKN